jgi:potassium channel subfamily K
VFVVYAFMAVPIVTSFAVQTISNIVSSVAEARVEVRRERLGLDSHMPPDFDEPLPHSDDAENEFFVSHAEWVAKHHELMGNTVLAPILRDPNADLSQVTDPEQRAQIDDALLDMLLASTLDLEAQARTLIIEQLPVTSRASLLLKADRNVQQRDIALLADGAERAGRPDSDFDQLEVLQQVHLYRKTFAALLVAGSKLKRLRGMSAQLLPDRASTEQYPIRC